jgi:hypothetical protein
MLVGHSFAGITISVAVEAAPEKIMTLVFVAAYLPKDGQSLLDLGNSDKDSKIGPHLQIMKDKGIIAVEYSARADLFCLDCNNQLRAAIPNLIVDEPLGPLEPRYTSRRTASARWTRSTSTLRKTRSSVRRSKRPWSLLRPCAGNYSQHGAHAVSHRPQRLGAGHREGCEAGRRLGAELARSRESELRSGSVAKWRMSNRSQYAPQSKPETRRFTNAHLCDREGGLGLRRSQRIEGRNLHEALHHQNEDVEIKRNNNGNHVNPAPRAYQMSFVQGKHSDDQDPHKLRCQHPKQV